MQPATPDPPDWAALTEALGGTRGASALYLRMALEALATEGAGGTIRIHIPRKTTDPVEVDFLGINGHPDKLTP